MLWEPEGDPVYKQSKINGLKINLAIMQWELAQKSQYRFRHRSRTWDRGLYNRLDISHLLLNNTNEQIVVIWQHYLVW